MTQHKGRLKGRPFPFTAIWKTKGRKGMGGGACPPHLTYYERTYP